jgi:hypothetical protein
LYEVIKGSQNPEAEGRDIFVFTFRHINGSPASNEIVPKSPSDPNCTLFHK